VSADRERLNPKERKRRRALRAEVAVALYNCDRCGVHAGRPCNGTGRARNPGQSISTPHKCRQDRARAHCALHRWERSRCLAAAQPIATDASKAVR
jgi:hypothetical protein